jgi:hypothetical protein
MILLVLSQRLDYWILIMIVLSQKSVTVYCLNLWANLLNVVYLFGKDEFEMFSDNVATAWRLVSKVPNFVNIL